MRLTKVAKNKIYIAIEESHLDPAECSIAVVYDEVFEDDAVVITHGSGSTFKYYHYKTRRDTLYKVRADVVEGTEQEYFIEPDIDELTPLVYDWANEIQHVADTPDLWVEMRLSKEDLFNIQAAARLNRPFTQDEQEQIAVFLQETKKQVREQFELTSEQAAHIEERLDEAAEASQRMGRKDWLLLFGGTIFNLIVTDTVTPSVAGHIFTAVVHGLIHMFTGGSGPPQILA
jgi:hypothetical protein